LSEFADFVSGILKVFSVTPIPVFAAGTGRLGVGHHTILCNTHFFYSLGNRIALCAPATGAAAGNASGNDGKDGPYESKTGDSERRSGNGFHDDMAEYANSVGLQCRQSDLRPWDAPPNN
jgi:hypothetical protein